MAVVLICNLISLQVFSHLFCLQLEEDVNEVIFGLCSASCIKEDSFPEAALQLEKLLKLEHPEISQSIINTTKKLRQLKWLRLIEVVSLWKLFWEVMPSLSVRAGLLRYNHTSDGHMQHNRFSERCSSAYLLECPLDLWIVSSSAIWMLVWVTLPSGSYREGRVCLYESCKPI